MTTLVPRAATQQRAARAGSLLRASAALCVCLFAAPPSAQPVVWEPLPVIPYIGEVNQEVPNIGFLYGEGAQADDPAADTLVTMTPQGTFLYNPSGAAGAAGDNGDFYGVWHLLCSQSICSYNVDGLVTAAQSIVIGTPAGATQFCRATDRGRHWVCNVDLIFTFPLFQSSLPALAAPDGTPALLAGVSDDGILWRSGAEGQPGTWRYFGGRNTSYPQVIGDVPPSPALPQGRILHGVWNGVLYSSAFNADGTATFRRSNVYGQGDYIARSFAFLPVAGHPYGGVALAGIENLAFHPGPRAEVYRSDDGGATWAFVYRFTPEESGQPQDNGANLSQAMLFVAPDGVLWAGVGLRNGTFPNRGGIMRSFDAGATWERADTGFAAADGRGYRVNQFKLARDGRLYVGTTHGVWRTTGVAVASEAAAPHGEHEAARLGVTVRPNPSSGRVSVVVTSAAAESVRVVVVDLQGREVAVVLDGSVSGERVVNLDTSSLARGVYVVRASAGETLATARLTVAR